MKKRAKFFQDPRGNWGNNASVSRTFRKRAIKAKLWAGNKIFFSLFSLNSLFSSLCCSFPEKSFFSFLRSVSKCQMETAPFQCAGFYFLGAQQECHAVFPWASKTSWLSTRCSSICLEKQSGVRLARRRGKNSRTWRRQEKFFERLFSLRSLPHFPALIHRLCGTDFWPRILERRQTSSLYLCFLDSERFIPGQCCISLLAQ